MPHTLQTTLPSLCCDLICCLFSYGSQCRDICCSILDFAATALLDGVGVVELNAHIVDIRARITPQRIYSKRSARATSVSLIAAYQHLILRCYARAKE